MFRPRRIGQNARVGSQHATDRLQVVAQRQVGYAVGAGLHPFLSTVRFGALG